MFQHLPDEKTLYQALLNRDSTFEGIFVVAVKTTGIFCRPTCTARKPKPENVEYFVTPRDALLHGYRPCKICRPLSLNGVVPDWLLPLLDEVSENPDMRLRNEDIRSRGLDPNRVSRWFKKHHGMTFQAYLRTLRIGQAFGRIRYGEKIVNAAYDSGYESLSGFTESFKKMTGVSPSKSSNGNLVTVTRILTPLGPMLAGADETGICLLEFIDRRMLETQLLRLKKWLKAEIFPGDSPYFKVLNQQIQEYFEGCRRTFDLPLQLPGTKFQKSVWAALQQIPYGETRTYGQQAQALGNPAAARAVARANGDNRISIIIPCHRVIGKNGEPVGYGGGVWRKLYLLDLEASNREMVS